MTNGVSLPSQTLTEIPTPTFDSVDRILMSSRTVTCRSERATVALGVYLNRFHFWQQAYALLANQQSNENMDLASQRLQRQFLKVTPDEQFRDDASDLLRTQRSDFQATCDSEWFAEEVWQTWRDVRQLTQQNGVAFNSEIGDRFEEFLGCVKFSYNVFETFVYHRFDTRSFKLVKLGVALDQGIYPIPACLKLTPSFGSSSDLGRISLSFELENVVWRELVAVRLEELRMPLKNLPWQRNNVGEEIRDDWWLRVTEEPNVDDSELLPRGYLGIVVDEQRRTISREGQHSICNWTPIEWNILRRLLRKNSNYLEFAELERDWEQLGGTSREVSVSTRDATISRLRAKISDLGLTIETRRSVGIRLAKISTDHSDS